MNRLHNDTLSVCVAGILVALGLGLSNGLMAQMHGSAGGSGGRGERGGGRPPGETTGNNLSFRVIWVEGITKALPGGPDMEPVLAGEWMWWWGSVGTDPNVVPLSAWPDPDDPFMNLTTGESIPMDDPDLVMALLQKDPLNVWRAEELNASGAPLFVHWVDWGDNLESVDWYTRSQVRTEVVLYQENRSGSPWLEYSMRHVAGWGIDEVHGLAAEWFIGDDGLPVPLPKLGPGDFATVYSHCARLTIQKLRTDRDDPALSALDWLPGEGWVSPPSNPELDLVNPPIFNKTVYEGGDGPGYYSAEINVKGRVISGYTWNVRQLNHPSGGSPAGDYRITFSFDANCGPAKANAFFDHRTQILRPVEVELEAAAAAEVGEEPTGGAWPVLVPADNLSYVDVRILERGGRRSR